MDSDELHALRKRLFLGECRGKVGHVFQEFFEGIMKMLHPSFIAISSGGGDWKSDGLLIHDDTVYAVYSPEQVKKSRKADTLKKLEEDYLGAKRYWPDMKKWVFVYNFDKWPPGIDRLLKSFTNGVEIILWDQERLWQECSNNLTGQQWSELLGSEVKLDRSVRETPSEIHQRKTRFLAEADKLLLDNGWHVELEKTLQLSDGSYVFPSPIYELQAWKRNRITQSRRIEYWCILRFTGNFDNILFYMEKGVIYMANRLIRNPEMNHVIEEREKQHGLSLDDLLLESKGEQLLARGCNYQEELLPLLEMIVKDTKSLQTNFLGFHESDERMYRIVPILVIDGAINERYPNDSRYERRKSSHLMITHRIESYPSFETIHIVNASSFGSFLEKIENEMRELSNWLKS